MSTVILPLLDQALTDLEALEKRLEGGQIGDPRHWPSLSLSIRKLATTSVELVNIPETRNRTNRAQMISFCARMKTIALIFHETLSTRELRGIPTFPTPGSGKIARSGKLPSSGRIAPAAISASKETDALLLPELKLLISKLSSNSSNLVEFEWNNPAKLGPQGASAVLEPLNWRNTFVRVLNLSNQQLGDLGASYVAKSMKTNRTIEVLDLSGNSVTSKGVEGLVDALLVSTPTAPVLSRLDLSHNLIDFSGCGHLARLVTNAESITTLLLNNNLLNDVGLTTIANALALNCSLTRLDLQQNPASANVSVGPIFSSVMGNSNYTLVKLDLTGARISDDEWRGIQASLDRNTILLEERQASQDHTLPRENAFKRMEIGPESARLHVFSSDVLSPGALLKLVISPLGANITSLILTKCGLVKLPPQLCLMGSHLEVLDLRRNCLTSLPLEIRAFFKLKYLHLAHNRLQHLPSQITALASLSSISLHGNPLQWIPQDVLSHAEIEDFPPADTRLFRFLSQSAAATDEEDRSLFGKLMILGQVHSGKTSLSQNLDSSLSALGSTVPSIVNHASLPPTPSTPPLNPNSSRDEQPSTSGSASPSHGSTQWTQKMPRYISTEGVFARSITIKGSKYNPESVVLPSSPEVSVVNKQATFAVIEAGGSQIYAAAHSIFFRPDILYLVTVDLSKLSPEHSRSTLSELKSMIQTIQTMVGHTTGGSPHIAIVGTFEDQLSPAALADALTLLKSHFEPHVLEIFSISNKSSQGLSILRDRVLFWSMRNKLLSSPRLGCISTIHRVLRSYSAVRPFISRLELEQICRVYGVGQARDRVGELVEPDTSPSLTSKANSNRLSTDADGDTSLLTGVTSEQLKLEDAIDILERLGAVTTFANAPQLRCYSFIDLQFVASVFSDIMAAADADGYIYRSHVPPLLWMDCRRHASMKSLFDWCRLFGLTLDCGDTHYIIPSLLNANPQVEVFNAAWPPLENVDGISSRPHMPPLTGSISPRSKSPVASGAPSSTGTSNSPSPNTVQAVTAIPGSLRLAPAIEKTSRAFLRDMSQVSSTEWPHLVRGIVTHFVPALVFSHILINVFSLPGMQRCAWWKNGFIVRRDLSSIKVTSETPANAEQGCKIRVEARNDSTFVHSQELLNEVCSTIDHLLKKWYPQLEYFWAVPWSHPWLPEDEVRPVPLLEAKERLNLGADRSPTSQANVTVREELLLPDLVDSTRYYTFKEDMANDALVPITSAMPSVENSNGQVFTASDGSIVRFRAISAHSLHHMALTLSILRNERIASLHSVYAQPSGVTVHFSSVGTLEDIISQTCTDTPLAWATRFRIAADLLLAVRFLHSQAPVMALQGLDSHSILLNSNYRDFNTPDPIVKLDLSAMNNQDWLSSVFAPAPYVPSVQQISQSTQDNTLKLSPHASDIYSLGVILLQLWRNESSVDFTGRVRHKVPPVPFYSPDSVGFVAFEQLISACVCEDPAMRPQIDQLISKMANIAHHMDMPVTAKLLEVNVPSHRWRRIKTLQISTSSDVSFSISALCQSTSHSLTTSNSVATSPRAQQFEETIVWAGGADGVLYGIPFSTPKSLGSSSSPAQPSTHPTSSASPLHWNTVSSYVLSSASVQYRMATFGQDTRNSRRRILNAVPSHRHIWCLTNTGTVSVLDSSIFAIVAQIEVGPSLSIAAFEDTIYIGGTTGILSAYDGTTCKRLRQGEIAKVPITAIAANSKFVWVALSEESASNAALICLDSQTLQEEGSYDRNLDDTITSLALTPSSDSANTEILWAGGYSGAVETLKFSTHALTDTQIKVEPHLSFPSAHRTRIQSLTWNGDFLYSSSQDTVIAWKPNGSGQISQLTVPSADLVSTTLLEKSCLITGHKNGCVTIWTSL